MSRQERPSSKAIKERKFRQREKERKRFQGPMQKFLEYKHPKVYEEYVELHILMKRNHPNVRDLSKTRTFKNWINTIDQTPPTDILATAIRETIGQIEMNVESEELNETAESEELNETPESEELNETPESEELNETPESEELNETPESEWAASILDSEEEARLESQIDAIINELMQDEDLRNAVDQETDDDGIEISLWDELAMDIEPFDYQLEVEAGDW